MRVILINLSVEDRFGLSGTKWVPPLGLISIASCAKKFGYELQIYDSNIQDESRIENAVLEDYDKDTVLGFYTSILNFEKVIKFAQKAKEKGATIVLGGPHASSLKVNIMRKRPFIDAVVSGEGEIPFLLFLRQMALEEIPNLTYRKNGEIIVNEKRTFEIDSLPLDYSLVDLPEYQRRFQHEKHEEFKSPIAYYTQRGCSWGKCIFCAIPIKKLTRKTPKRVWQEIAMLKGLYQIDYVYETGDSFTDDPSWLEKLVSSKPSNIEVSWEIFSRANVVDEQVAKNLKKIGVYKVYTGVETGNQELLRRVKKGHTLEDVLNAARLLGKHGIKFVPSFMCGVLGETEASLKKTLAFAKKVRDISNSDEAFVFPMTPLPNSFAYKMLLAITELKEKYVDEDCPDIEELQKDWHKYFCKVSQLEMRTYMEAIRNVYRI